MAKPTPSIAVLKTLLSYDPETGHFTWLQDRARGKVKAGARAGTWSNSTGYIYIRVLDTSFGAHRLAFLFMTGETPPHDVDHINGVRDDNRWVNLRLATPGQNRQNRRSPQRTSSTGYLGVSFDKSRGKFFASIMVNRRQKNLGRYATAEEAHAAYVRAKRELHPFGTL